MPRGYCIEYEITFVVMMNIVRRKKKILFVYLQCSTTSFFVDKNLSFPLEGYFKCKTHKHEMIILEHISYTLFHRLNLKVRFMDNIIEQLY